VTVLVTDASRGRAECLGRLRHWLSLLRGSVPGPDAVFGDGDRFRWGHAHRHLRVDEWFRDGAGYWSESDPDHRHSLALRQHHMHGDGDG